MRREFKNNHNNLTPPFGGNHMKGISLLQLAEHLEKGELLHEEFTFDNINSTPETSSRKGVAYCGTMGCAMGEMPLLDKAFTFSLSADLRLGEVAGLCNIAGKYWGTTEREGNHLFFPNLQNTEKYGGVFLENNATKEQVAFNIREFVAKTGKNECIYYKP